jgi:23S rRNA (guanosine2251-2'-O)-methyltransferase
MKSSCGKSESMEIVYRMKVETMVLLHNVRSTHNVGSIFRTADAAGVSKILLTGYTPAPTDRFGRPQKDIAKTALGAERYLQWEHAKSPMKMIRDLKKEGWVVVGVEQDERAQDYRELDSSMKRIFLFGNEVRGLSKNLRNLCDRIIEIPMHGKKESLNVSVTAGIILFSALSSRK